MELNTSSVNNKEYTGKADAEKPGENKNQQDSANSGTPDLNAQKGKGTGMSSEAGSSQTEESWQDETGSNANADSDNQKKL